MMYHLIDCERSEHSPARRRHTKRIPPLRMRPTRDVRSRQGETGERGTQRTLDSKINSAMAKRITSITVQLVTFESDRLFADVIARLDEEINKAGSHAAMLFLRGGMTTPEIANKFKETLKDRDFLHFFSLSHSKWVKGHLGVDTVPAASMYIFGNPFIAANIMQHDIQAGLNIPPRLLVMEKEDRNGTKVIYHLPSSVIPISENSEQKMIVESLDEKVERLVVKILTT